MSLKLYEASITNSYYCSTNLISSVTLNHLSIIEMPENEGTSGRLISVPEIRSQRDIILEFHTNISRRQSVQCTMVVMAGSCINHYEATRQIHNRNGPLKRQMWNSLFNYGCLINLYLCELLIWAATRAAKGLLSCAISPYCSL